MADLPEEKEKLGDGGPPLEEDVEDSQTSKADTTLEGSGMECPICLQQCMHPVELPCRHVFCYLCIKGVAMQGPNSRCAICRATIPISVLTNPQLKDISQLYKEPKLANGYQWYYESRGGGWWQYDERTMQDLERAFSSNQASCQLLLAGHLYVVDFTQMIQYRSTNRSVSRRIKRGINLEKRGVAGIRIAGSNTGNDTSGAANNGSSPPPQPSSGPSTRRRRGNSSAAPSSSQQPTATSGQHPQSSASGSINSAVGNSSAGHSQSTTSDSPREPNDHIADSDDESIEEDEDYDSDYSDVDDDMELGEEEEGLIGDDSDERETEDEEEYEARDGARAPTSRSDRSNSSNNQTPPPPGTAMGNGGVNGTYSPNPNNGRGSRGAKSGRSSGGRSSNSNNGTASRSAAIAMSDSLSSTVPSHHATSSPIIGQVNYTMSQTVNNIGSTSSVKIAFEKHSRHHNQEEYL